MNVVVNDANILIDLVKLQLLPHYFSLGWGYYTTSLVFEELYEEQQRAFTPYQGKNIFLLVDLSVMELECTVKLQLERPQLSLQDCSALYYAIKTSAILLSSDKNLREFAKIKQVEVHGHLWLFDIMVNQNCLNPLLAAEKLQELIEAVNPKLRLPLHDCKKRIEN